MMKRFTLVVSIVFTALLLALLAVVPGLDSGNELLLFFGRFHPLMLHVPIGALLVLCLLEFVQLIRPKLELHVACSVVLWFSAVTCLPVVALGFLLASGGGYNEELLRLHKWLGWGTAVVCAWLLVLRGRMSQGWKAAAAYRSCLLVNIALLSLAGHYGGSLTHGSDYLTKYMPKEWKARLGVELTESEKMVAAILEEPGEEISEEARVFAEHVQPLMGQYCYGCHGPDKQKGDIRLDLLNWDMINGPDAEGWHTALDQINAGEMPPKGKAQFSDEERRLVVDWMTESLEVAAEAKRGESKGVMRRLTKDQYSNTLNDLLQLPNRFGDVLPDDGKSEMGFSNNGEILQASPLHIDYFQKIAREALDKAIVAGAKPEPIRYKVTFGEGSGRNLAGGEFGGFQSASVSADHFTVEILDADGNPRKSADPEEQKKLDALKKKIGIGLRGSSSDRYSVVPEGMMLYSALPHINKPPRSWQGPSPNMKMIVKNEYPREGGAIMMRVEASRGYNWSVSEGMIGIRGKSAPAERTGESIVVEGATAELKSNMVLGDDGVIRPNKLTAFSDAALKFKVVKDGYYQIDLVHPYVSADNMPAFRVKVAKFNRVDKRLKLNEEQADLAEITTPVSLAYLKVGNYSVTVGGKFFVGMKQLVITPLADDNPLSVKLAKEAEENRKKYEGMKPSVRVFAGARTDDGMDYLNFDQSKVVHAPFGEFETLEFQGRLEDLPLPVFNPHAKTEFANMMSIGLWNDYLVKEKGDSGPPLLVKSIEIEAPYFEAWPPKSHTSIFIDSPNKANEETYTREILSGFIERAYRRTASDSELNRYLTFWKGLRGDYDRYEDSVQEVLVAVLCSPHFLYIVDQEEGEAKEADDAYFLASQLSYFLWNTAPDQELVDLARTGKLRANLPGQVERMVKDPRVLQMVRSFAYEWLRIDRQQSIKTNVGRYKDYSRFVREDMPEETYQFIYHVLKENLSVLNFVDSDFAVLNQNLAEFYGIEGVEGNDFRPVSIARNLHRGGLLSQGAFLTGHSDGEQAHPIKRAVWLKEKILGDPPPPAPPNVPELDPDTPGFEKMTLKEQLDLHRSKPSCIDCHEKIDPYGIVFENYDAVGRFQTTAKGKPVDSATVLPDGTEVVGIDGIKAYILDQKSRDVTRSLVEHLFAYALGRDIGFADEKEIDAIVDAVCNNNYSFQTVIEQIVLSPSFTKEHHRVGQL